MDKVALAGRLLERFPQYRELYKNIEGEYVRMGRPNGVPGKFIERVGRQFMDEYRTSGNLEAITPFIAFVNEEYSTPGDDPTLFESRFINRLPDPLQDPALAALLSPKVRSILDEKWDWRATASHSAFIQHLLKSFPQLQPSADSLKAGREQDVLAVPFMGELQFYLEGRIVDAEPAGRTEASQILAFIEAEYGTSDEVDQLIRGWFLNGLSAEKQPEAAIIDMLGPKLSAARHELRVLQGYEQPADNPPSNEPSPQANADQPISSPEAAKARAAQLLKVEPTHFDNAAEHRPEIEAYYLWERIRGGRSLIVGHDGSLLFAVSSVTKDAHLADFAEGKRTPENQFE